MIRLDKVEKSFGKQKVLHSLCATFSEQITALMGPSGSGKTTLLRLIAGLETPDSGEIVGTKEKKITYLFQEPRLLPWMTAEQNIRAVQEKNPNVSAKEWLHRVGLAEAAHKFPDELSGGMRQRVALARALAFGGEIILLDEPFKEIDVLMKDSLMELLRREVQGRTVLWVTHSETEAQEFADSVWVLEHKTLHQKN